MKSADVVNRNALESARGELEQRFAAFKEQKLSLDMTRGKPSPEQLDLANGMLTVLGPDDYRARDGTDCRNYGGIDGLDECKTLLAEFMEVAENEVLIGDNSSLALMHDTIARALSHGVPGGDGPWSRGRVKVLCPSPGYDRHFTVCEHFDIEMLVTQMMPDGPDMDAVEDLAASDPSVKGIWVVPKYSNPTGVTCSSDGVERLARMKTAAPDFRVFWDNAYAHHHLTDERPELANLLDACKAAGNPDRVFSFGSTSKISFAGSGIAVFAASERNVAWLRDHRSKQTIGPDKINQLRHVRFFESMEGIEAHMRRHAAILKPKFDAVHRVLSRELGDKGIARWTRPRGGYFVSLDTMEASAKRVISMASEVGVKLTAAGATFPYGKDPRDQNIRIAPSLPTLGEIERAMEVLAVCVQRAALERLGTAS